MAVANIREYGTTAIDQVMRRGFTSASVIVETADLYDVPADELWLWRNTDAMEALLQGRAQAARGDVLYLGSFAQYADLQIDD